MANNIFRRLTSTPEMMAVFDDVSFVKAMLEFELALAVAEAENGLFEWLLAVLLGVDDCDGCEVYDVFDFVAALEDVNRFVHAD